jgi:hypothetical protein
MRNVWSLTDFRHGFYWKVEKDGVHIAFLIVSLWQFVWVPMWWQMQKIWKFGLLILVAASEVLLVCNSVFHHQTSHSVCLTLCLESQQNTGRRDFLESKRDAHILSHMHVHMHAQRTCTCSFNENFAWWSVVTWQSNSHCYFLRNSWWVWSFEIRCVMDPFACNRGIMLLFFFRTYEVQGLRIAIFFF